jgi:hypothetical protein
MLPHKTVRGQLALGRLAVSNFALSFDINIMIYLSFVFFNHRFLSYDSYLID